MIKLLDILNELEIQPNIPDPIKRKGLHVGDTIEWADHGIKYKDTIQRIRYYNHNSNSIVVTNWKEATFVEIIPTREPFNLYYNKCPIHLSDKYENEQFDSIKKLS